MFLYALPAANLARSLTPTIVTGTPLSGYGLSRLVDLNLSSPFKIAGTDLELTYDLGASTAVQGVILHHTNIDGTVLVRAHTTSDFTGAVDISTAMTMHAIDGQGYFPTSWLDRRALAAKRYLNIKVTGNSRPIILGELELAATVNSIPGANGGSSTASLLAQGERGAQGGDSIVIPTESDLRLSFTRDNRRGRTDGRMLVRIGAGGGLEALRTLAQSVRWRARTFTIIPEHTENYAYRVNLEQDDIVHEFVDGSLVAVPLAFAHETLAEPWVEL